MSLLHSFAAYARGPLSGIQSTQRDFSPYVAHFTTWSAMTDLRRAAKERRSPEEVAALFHEADAKSWQTARTIIESKTLVARSPSQKDRLPACVCFSECSLPGLMSHCERYGRFGFVFSKLDLYRAGGRPCIYVGHEEYACIAERGRDQPTSTAAGRLFALSNVFQPPNGGNKLQDYTHEREWRVFGDVDLQRVSIAANLAPAPYVHRLLELRLGAPVIPIDTLFDWGA
jgi:hypothetical protein